MHRLLIGYCIFLFTSCIEIQPQPKHITVIYCPEINKPSFYIPKDITGVFKSQNIGGVNYEIITDSKIRIINGEFENPVDTPIFNSISQMIFGSPNQIKTNELITSELHTIRFEKKKSLKPYPSEPSENQIFIFYNTKNINQTVGRKYYVNSSDQISKVISKHRNDKKNFYIFNSQQANKKNQTKLPKKRPNTDKPIHINEDGIPDRKPKTPITSNTLPKLKIDLEVSEDQRDLTWFNNSKKSQTAVSYEIIILKNNKQIISKNNITTNKISCADLNTSRILNTDCSYKIRITAKREADGTECTKVYGIELTSPDKFFPHCHLNSDDE
jgi:hypothetical protein